MTDRIVLITGTSSGIGYATAAKLLDLGMTVYATAPAIEPLGELRQSGARVLPLDVADDPSMVAAVERVLADCGRIDVLINNAGYGSYGALEDVPMDEARRQFEVNVIGAARLIQLVLPARRAAGRGRIINVGSVGGVIWEPFGAWYHASKFALEGLTDSLRVELTPFGIDVVLVRPGAIRSGFGAVAAQRLRDASGHGVYGPYARRYAERALEGGFDARSASSPDEVADGIAKVVTVRRPRTRYAIGGGAKSVLRIKALMPDRMFDRLIWSQAKL